MWVDLTREGLQRLPPLAAEAYPDDATVDDALRADIVPVPRRPDPVPACSDAEVLTIALVRLAWAQPDQSEFNRRVRRLWGANTWSAGCLRTARQSGLRAGGAARLRPTARGSTASGWRSGPTWARGWCGPGAVADALLAGARPPGLLLDRGFAGRGWVATRVLLTPSRAERAGELTERLGLAPRTAATILAQTLLRLRLV